MNHIDTVFESSSREIFNLTKNLINVDFQDKLLDTFMIKNRTKKSKRKENVHFKAHPNLLSSDSDISGQTFQNDYQKYHLTLQDECCDFGLENKNSFLFTPRQKEISPELSSFDLQDFINSPKIDHILKNNTYTPSNVNLKLKEKDSIEPKLEVEKTQRQKKNSAALERLVEKKLIHFLQKTFTCLDDISLSLSNKITLPDGQEDWQRRRIRTIEFSSRFQRNYLYQLGLQITELQKLIKGSHSQGHHKTVPQCVLTAHQTLLQAFQAYNNNIPTCLGNVVVDKLKLAIDYANNLFKVHQSILVPEDLDADRKRKLIESITDKFDVVLRKAKEAMSETIVHVPPKTPAIKLCRSTSKLHKYSFRKRIDSKLSMYTISTVLRKQDGWKKSLDPLSHDRHIHTVQSRYKTAGFKHRPPVAKNKTPNTSSRRLGSKKSVANIRNTPLVTPKNEDAIETMMEVVNGQEEKEKCNDDPQLSANLETIMPLLKGICEKIIGSGDVVNQGELENVLKGLLDMTLTGTIDKGLINKNFRLDDDHKNGTKRADGSLKNLLYKKLPNLLKKIQNGKVEPENGKKHFESASVELNLSNLINDDEDYVQNNESNKNWQTVCVSGQKNAQLICIRDNSATPDLDLNQPNPSLATLTRESTLEEITRENAAGTKLHTIKISRLPKSTAKVIRPLSKAQIKSILQGKLRQTKYMKGNPMYCKTSKKHPWHIVEQIAESLLNDVLLSIAQEIQVNNILESLYNSEFQ